MNKNYAKTSEKSSSSNRASEPSSKTIDAILNYSKSVTAVKVMKEKTLVNLN